MTPSGADTPAIYAVNQTAGDVYKSTDRGESWSPTGAPSIAGEPPWSLAVDPNNPSLIYAASNYNQGRLYKSTDGGENWTIKANGLPPSVPSSIVVDPRNSSVYVGLDEGGIYKSTDAAESWVYSSLGISNCYILNLVVDPFNSKKVFAVPFGTGQHIAKTTNGGLSWTHLQNSPTDQSTGAGETWTNISHNAPDEWVEEVRDIEVDLGSKVYAATNAGLMKWNGSVWTKLAGLPGDDINAVAIDISVNPGILYVAVRRQGVFVSKDSGLSWASFNTGLQSFNITKLAVSKFDPEILYAGTAYEGVWGRALTNTILPWISLLLFGG